MRAGSPLLTLTPATESFLTTVERHVNRKFRYRPEIGLLVDALTTAENIGRFERLVFYAKFLTHANGILTRSGIQSEETGKLAQEYAATMEQSASLLRSILTGVQDEQRKHLETTFLGMTQEHMKNFIALMAELSWIKNYLLDTDQPVKTL